MEEFAVGVGAGFAIIPGDSIIWVVKPARTGVLFSRNPLSRIEGGEGCKQE